MDGYYVVLREDQIEVEDTLSLRHLGISRMDEIKGLQFMVQLKDLDLMGNRIGRIEGLDALMNLTQLNLGDNNIKKIGGLRHLAKLERLMLRGNRIAEIEGLEPLAQLTHLDLGDNHIREILGLGHLTKLAQLALHGNRIGKIEGLETLTTLTHLDLGNNRISKIEGLENLPNLTHLNLQGNQLSSVQGLENLRNLRVLDLSDNKITDLQGLTGLPHLHHLNLEHNKISEANAFQLVSLETLPSLKTLQLEWNPIRTKRYTLFDRRFDGVARQIARESEQWLQIGSSKSYYLDCLGEFGNCTITAFPMEPGATRKWIKNHADVAVVPKKNFISRIFPFLRKKPPYQLWVGIIERSGEEKFELIISPVTKKVVHATKVESLPAWLANYSEG